MTNLPGGTSKLMGLNFLRKRQTGRKQPLGGRYKLLGQLGAGGFGQTFRAQDLHLPGQPLCVVKHLKPQVSSAAELQIARRLFDTEAQVLYQLGSHPQIPNLLAHFEQDNEFYLAQELIEGHSLADEFATGERWPEALVVNFLEDVLTTLAFVHENRVIHRDLKPSNLIRRQQDHRIVLIDFGAVKQASTQVISHSNGVSQTISIGTQGYMPNEQIAGRPQFSSDVYAVGIMGIQALSGRHPKLLVPHPQTGELDWLHYVPKANPELVAILDMMVRYDFRSRYLTAQDALTAVQLLPAALREHRPPGMVSPAVESPVNRQSSSPPSIASFTPAVAYSQPTVPLTTVPKSLVSPASRQKTLAVMGQRNTMGVASASSPTTVRKLPLIVIGAIATLLGLSLLVWMLFPSSNSTTPDPVATAPTSENTVEDAVEDIVEEGAEVTDSPTAPSPAVSQAAETSVPEVASPERVSRVAQTDAISADTAPVTPEVAPEPTTPDVNPESVTSEAEPEPAAPEPRTKRDNTDDTDTSAGGSGANVSPEAAQGTISSFYRNVSSQSWDAARSLTGGTLAQQFDPNFFGQFQQVTVENLRVTGTATDTIELSGQNTYIYPDGSTQIEERTFRVRWVDGQPRIVSSVFVSVIKAR